MQFDEVFSRLEAARTIFLARDRHLLTYAVNERSMTHKFAEYMQMLFDEWHVDCEYNRDGGVPKEMEIEGRTRVRKDDTNASTVFPDIIVHIRGREGPNLLVVEAKKSGQNPSEDKHKLNAYRYNFGYQYTAQVLFITGEDPDVKIEPV